MGKGDRNRQRSEEKKLKQLEREKALARRRRNNAIIAVIAVIIALAGVGTLVGINLYKNSGSAQRAQVAVESENFKVDGAMMSYFINSSYASYVNYYGDYLQYYSTLDVSKPLKSQNYSDTKTWFEYFADSATELATDYLRLAEGAKAKGIELTAEEIAAGENRAKMISEVGYLGKGVKLVDVTNCRKLMALAEKYTNIYETDFVTSQEEISAHYKENPLDFDLVDYYVYSFSYVKEDSETEGLTQDEAKANAEALAAATSPEEYETILNEYLTEIESTATADTYQTTKGTYTEDDEVSEWLFDEETAVGGVKLVEDKDNSKYTVYMLSKTRYIRDDKTVAVRHALLSTSVYGTIEAAKKEAEKLLAEWESGDKSEESFATMALGHSTDDGSSMNGGLYTGVEQGTMVTNFDECCFNESRQLGYTGNVESDYVVHIMYFVGEDLPVWQYQVRMAIITEAFTEVMEELTEAHKISTYAAIIAQLPA